MKKILIVNKSFETGGIQASMVNMANELSRYYQVDLLLYAPEGNMKERLAPAVNVLPPSWRMQAVAMPLKALLRDRDLRKILFKLTAGAWTKLFGNAIPIQAMIKHQPLLSGYDLAIAYHQEQRRKTLGSGFSRVVLSCTDAKTKAAWVHFDSATIDIDSEYNNRFYEKMDRVVCVSGSLMRAYAENNPALSDKVDFCYNFIDYDALLEKASALPKIPFEAHWLICFSATRLTAEKALPRAIHSLGRVFRENPDVTWYIAGDGPERENILDAIRQEGVEEQIRLIGNQSNPYCYMKNADLVMNVSYHEAAPMVYFEAKALGVPVFATKTASSEELLRNGEDSFICENSEQGLYEAFRDLMQNRERIRLAKECLKGYSANNDASLKKIQELLEGKFSLD